MTLRHGSPGRTKSNDDGSKLLDLRNSTMFVGSSRVSNVVANDGESSPLGIWSLEPDVLVGGVELRSLESDEVNLSYQCFPDSGDAVSPCERHNWHWSTPAPH